MAALSAFAFVERVDACTAEANEALRGPLACDVMQLCLDTLTDEALATPASANAYLRHLRHSWRSRRGMRGKLVMFPLRAALTGTMVGPCLGVVTSLLGRERCCGRLEARLRDATQG
jgi:glutamyl/glutaminyl-tRNA synthetase